MAQKKYVSLEKLSLYNEKIKALINANDATTLASAKTYADSLADNYEAAGSVNTAKTELETKISAVEAKVDTAKAAADTAQGEVDALETLVGTLPEDAGVSTVVAYVNKKTTGIATDETVSTIDTRVTQAEKDIDDIQADYLKAADKTELANAVAAEANRADTAEKANAAAIKAISDDYLKSSDKTTLEASIANAKKAGDDAQADIDAFFAAAEVGDAAIDTLKEIQTYITSDGAAAVTMTSNIAENANAIAALDTKVGTIPTDGVAATNVVAYVQEVVGAEQTRATEVENSLDGRLDTIEAKFGSGEGSVADQITDAKTEAINTAATDATTKADQAKTDAIASAKTYTDTEVGKDRTRLDALEAVTHTHSNKDLLDTYDQTNTDIKDAVIKKHSHTNFETLEGITSGKVTAWDKVTAKADQTALNDEIARAKAAEEANANAIANFVEVSEDEINALFTV